MSSNQQPIWILDISEGNWKSNYSSRIVLLSFIHNEIGMMLIRRLQSHRNDEVPKEYGNFLWKWKLLQGKMMKFQRCYNYLVGMALKTDEDCGEFLIQKSQCYSMTCKPSQKDPEFSQISVFIIVSKKNVVRKLKY